MDIRPVNSEQAYDEAIERIETLWGAESGAPEGDELDVLLTLVRVYENENHPVPPQLLSKLLTSLWTKKA